ncbi:MAG: sigma-54 dependent transcriptional regulator [Pseudomonadota bacterium]
MIDGPDGERYLGEAIFPLSAVQDVDCEEMRLIGRSPAFLHAMERLSQAAASTANVLLLGESGVGKELAARYVHDHSPRAGRDFLALDCASINETLFESEVFGHERGAFTGCIGRKQGLFELADGGTLFLDEIGEVPLGMQAKLLRVLESGEFRRVGGREILRADVRVVAATNRDLRQMMREGRFREDLYYRLACITVPLPSLRERRSDIPALAEALLARLTAGNGQRCYLTGEALARLSSYDFPGNVRELRNMLQRAVVLARHGAITAQDLDLPDTAVPPLAAQAGPAAPSVKSLRDLEFQMVRDLLARFDGNRRQVAEALGVSERTVYRKLRQYGLLRRE